MDWTNVLLLPPLAFAIILVAVVGLSLFSRRIAFRRKDQPAGLTKPYACGEETPDQMVQPDYGEFFPFALFFTILHVVALMLMTVPVGTASAIAIAAIYIVIAMTGLVVLYRR